MASSDCIYDTSFILFLSYYSGEMLRVSCWDYVKEEEIVSSMMVEK